MLSNDARSKKLEEIGLQPDNRVLISVGRLVPEKDHAALIRALRLLVRRFPTLNLLLAGDGQERKVLEALARELSVADHISFLGFRDDVQDLLFASDLFIFPSVSEGHPIALLEAMAAGKPIVAARIPPIEDILEGGQAGYLVEPGNHEAIASGVTRLLLTPTLAKSLGQRAQEVVARRFDAREAAGQLAGVYRSLVRGRESEADSHPL